jgi:hypothetical protein
MSILVWWLAASVALGVVWAIVVGLVKRAGR